MQGMIEGWKVEQGSLIYFSKATHNRLTGNVSRLYKAFAGVTLGHLRKLKDL